MKIIYYLGIGIPLVVILSIVFVGIFDFGVSVEANSPEVVILNDDPQTIRTIKITNDFILTRREPIDYVLCPNNSQGYIYPTRYEVYVDGIKSDNINYVDVQPGESKIIEIKMTNLASDYRSFESIDELVLFETSTKSNYYSSTLCRTLLKNNDGIYIKLDKSGYVAPSKNYSVRSKPTISVISVDTSKSCNESDGGQNYYVKGTTKVKSGDAIAEYTDSCNNSLLEEWFCCTSNACDINMKCPWGCSDGACIRKSFEDKVGYKYVMGGASFISCYRSINDLNQSKYIKGSVIYEDGRTNSDSCADSGAVWEVGCFEANGYTQTGEWRIDCDVGELCKDGACVKS